VALAYAKAGFVDGAYRVEMRIVEDDLAGPEIRALLQIHFDGMLANSPPGSCHFLDFDGLRAPGVTFWSIWDDDELAGCGAIKELDPAHGEIKSMRTAEAHLGKHVGSEMLSHIVEIARQRGCQRLSLETGSTEAFAAAINLYERFGFVACEPFGDYKPDPFSRFFTFVL
jgi:putative acetyltransferase